MQARTGDFRVAFAFLGASLFLAGLLILLLRLNRPLTARGIASSVAKTTIRGN